ncbi:MAG: caspase family protein [Minwuia sp.]|nr:caspase family protein [Minwuia sp.]
MWRLTATLILSVGILVAPIARAELRALVIGVEADSPGAVADAIDVADALGHVHGRDISLLTNEQAHPAAVRAALDTLGAQARPGDLIIFAFAGAGGQQPEMVLGSEPDQLDEVYRLADEDLQTGLRDAELATWAGGIAERGAAVLLLLDTGHVDTPRRAAALPSNAPAHRGLAVQPVQRWPDDPDAFSALAYRYHASSPEGLEQLPPNVILLEATNRPDHAATTFALRDPATGMMTTRGPLSHAFARALRGDADANRDGQITAGELERHLRATIRQVTDGAGKPGISFRFAAGSVLFFIDQARASVSPRPFPPTALDRDVAVDRLRRQVHSARGDLIAEHVGPDSVPAIADSRVAIDQLHALARSQPLDAGTRPDEGLWAFGERFSIHIGDPELPYHLIANITGHGTVQMLFPEPNDPPDRLGGLLDDLAVLGPFGTDSVVIIATAVPVPALYAAFRSWDGYRFTEKMAGDITRMVQQQAYRIAVLPIVSAAGGGASQ